MYLKSFLAAAASTVGILTLSSPASAVIYNWQFTNEDGNFGSATDVVAGFVEFNDADVTPGATNVAATNLQITSVTGLTDSSAPFFGDGGIELNTNLLNVGVVNPNSFSFGGDEEIDFNSNPFPLRIFAQDNFNSGIAEIFQLYVSSSLRDSLSGETITDFESSTLTFTQQSSASVPFEFSPTLGLFLAGSIFAGRGYIKRRQARSIIETK